METEKWKICPFKELKASINVYDFFNKNYVDVFRGQAEIENCITAMYTGDLTIDRMEELPPEIEILIVRGNFTIHNRLDIKEYGTMYSDGYVAKIGALIVTGNLQCQSLYLSWADIAVMGNLIVEKFIYSDAPEYEQGTLHVHGKAQVPYIFRKNEYHPDFMFKQNNEIVSDETITKYVFTEYEESVFYPEDMCTPQKIFTADTYYRYLKEQDQ